MNKIIYSLIFNRKKSLNNKGMALLQIQAYLQRKKKYFSTNIYLKPEQWDSRKQQVKNHPHAEALNQMLYERMSAFEKEELHLWKKGKEITLNGLKEAMIQTIEESSSFLSFYRKEVKDSLLKESTKLNHLSTLALLKCYRKDISFNELTFDFVSAFETFLQSKRYHINTIGKHMKHLKRYVNLAINKDLLEVQKYAFRKYKIKSVESNHTHLSPDELTHIEKLQLGTRHARLQQTIDGFLFCCYAGLRYSDYVKLNSDNIMEINKQTWLVYRSVKTRTEVRLPLYLLFGGKAIRLLKKYKNNLTELFKIRNNSNVNKELLIIANLAGISKRISFHTARHTNATLLIYSGVNITTVQKLLGHRSIKTTQGYTNIMDITIVSDLEKSQTFCRLP